MLLSDERKSCEIPSPHNDDVIRGVTSNVSVIPKVMEEPAASIFEGKKKMNICLLF
jgi:hypothetical protein